MTTKRATKRQPSPKLAKGIRVYYREGRNNPWYVEWRDQNRRRNKSFDSEKTATRFALQLSEKTKLFGTQALNFDPAEWNHYLSFKAELEKMGISDLSAALDIIKKAPKGKLAKTPLSDVTTQFLDVKEFEGVSHEYFRHMKQTYKQLGEFFSPDYAIQELTTEDIRRFLDSLKGNDGGPATQTTRRNKNRDVRAMLSYAVDEGLLDNNVASKVRTPKPEETDITVIALKNARHLFKIAKDHPYIGRLALEAFAGLRPSGAQRITREMINFEDKALDLPGFMMDEDTGEKKRIMKSGRRAYIQGLPDNLWTWLKHTPEECWSMDERTAKDAKSEIVAKAFPDGLPKNVLRHSFCSYHVSLFKDAARTAVILHHTNPTRLYSNYRGKADIKDAKKYFSILPNKTA